MTLLRQVAHYKQQIDTLQQLAQHSQQSAALYRLLHWADCQQRAHAVVCAIAKNKLTRRLAAIGGSPVLNAMLLAAPLGKKMLEELGGARTTWSEHKALRMGGDAAMIVADLACAAALLADDVTIVGILTDVGLIPIAHDAHQRSRRLGKDMLETAAAVAGQTGYFWRHLGRKHSRSKNAQATPTQRQADPALLPHLPSAEGPSLA